VVGGLLALALSPATASAGELQNLLDKSKAFAALPRMKHTPAFRLEPIQPAEHAKGTEWFYICDGNERIGLIQTWIKEIEMFRFSPAAGGDAEKYELPEYYHWGNLYGARIQMYGTQMLPPVTSFELKFTKDRGDSLELTVEHHHRKDISGTSEFRLVWDERLGYVWNCVSRYSMPEPAKIEFNNLFAGGISEARDGHKRWQKTVRALADGRIASVYHNPINIPADDIQAGGFVGFVTEEEMNPFVELIETTSPVVITTCSQWYDQHIIMKPPRTKQSDGLYHLQARYRFLSVPGAVARDLEAVAEDVSKSLKSYRNSTTGESIRAGFLLNKVNDFETVVPPDEVYNGPIWQHINATEGPAHSGKKSIAVKGPGPGKVKSALPIGGGPGIYGESSERYRLAAWVKTQGLDDGGAYLQVDDCRWNWDDVKATSRTEKLTGDHEWTRLEIEFTPSPNDPFLLVKLCVEGTGTAWFDDLELAKVDSEAADGQSRPAAEAGTKVWSKKEIETLSKRFGIRHGIQLHAGVEDYHFHVNMTQRRSWRGVVPGWAREVTGAFERK
jgi:hypothetical protein